MLDQFLIGKVSRIPKPGETVPGSDFSTAPGGKGANHALAARRAGAEVRMFAAAGNDSFADEALKLLRADGVNLAICDRHKAPLAPEIDRAADLDDGIW